MSKIQRVIAIADLHLFDNISYKPVLKYLHEVGCDILVFGGDIWDLGYLSHWSSDNFKNVGFQHINSKLVTEAKKVKGVLKEFVEASGASKIFFIEGNHERWIGQYVEKYPQVEELTVQNLLGLKGLGIKFIPMEENVKIGNLVFVHGQQYGTENPVKQAVIRSHRNVVMFHHHAHKEWPGFSDLDVKDKVRCISVPCYCHRGPLYLKGRANAWSNGFFLAYVKPSGNFTSYIIEVSPKGNFIGPDGKEFV